MIKDFFFLEMVKEFLFIIEEWNLSLGIGVFEDCSVVRLGEMLFSGMVDFFWWLIRLVVIMLKGC